MRKSFTLASLLLGLLSACTAQHDASLTSPDGQLNVKINLEKGELFYEVFHEGKRVLEPSSLGIRFKERDLGGQLSWFSSSASRSVNESYQLISGKQSEVTYQANETSFIFVNPNNQQLQVTFRLSNDGVAFKYTALGDQATDVEFEQEETSFNFQQDALAWLQPVAVAQTGWANTNPSYEEHYEMGVAVTESSPSPAGWVFPALYQTNETWVAITEAGLSASFHASRLAPSSPDGEYRLGQPMAAEVFTGGKLLAHGKLPFSTPWRVLAIGGLGDVADSTLGTDLAEPAITMDTSFIKPGYSSWSWGLLKDDFTIYEVQKQFIDHAANMNWQYTLVDADWDRKIGYDKITELVEYGRSKGVDLWVWYNSSGDWNKTEYSPKGALLDAQARDKEFARLAQMGVKGLKIDFFAGDGQSMIAYYHAILQDAAKHKLMINFHGATLPRGWHKTYPHLMTAEAVHGFEMITFFQSSADKVASHSAMLPFARNLFDPMDFTPTTFNEIPNMERKTSNAFDLAQAVLFVSGVQHIVETPEGMKRAPYFAQDLLRELPASWDESRYLAGFPGKLAVFARRKGETWYIAGINGEAIDKVVELDLSFLQGRELDLITSGVSNRHLNLSQIQASGKLSLPLKGNDGFVMKLR